MIESRRMPRVTPSSCSIPASSGLRWTFEWHIRATRSSPAAGSPPATPQIPHISGGSRRPHGSQVGAGDRQVAGPGAETKEGVALGGAQLKLRDDDGPGPLTHVS